MIKTVLNDCYFLWEEDTGGRTQKQNLLLAA